MSLINSQGEGEEEEEKLISPSDGCIMIIIIILDRKSLEIKRDMDESKRRTP